MVVVVGLELGDQSRFHSTLSDPFLLNYLRPNLCFVVYFVGCIL